MTLFFIKEDLIKIICPQFILFLFVSFLLGFTSFCPKFLCAKTPHNEPLGIIQTKAIKGDPHYQGILAVFHKKGGHWPPFSVSLPFFVCPKSMMLGFGMVAWLAPCDQELIKFLLQIAWPGSGYLQCRYSICAAFWLWWTRCALGENQHKLV